MTYNITFNEQELSFVLSVLGDMPTKSNAYIVVNAINAQLQSQQQEAPAVAEPA
jgi:hypothetical protein